MIYVNTLPQEFTPIENYPLQNKIGNIITSDDVKERLLNTIPYKYTMYIIGGMVNRGYSNNDIDIFIEEKISLYERNEIEKMFITMLKYRIHIINVPLNEEKWAPIYMYKIYQNGQKIIY